MKYTEEQVDKLVEASSRMVTQALLAADVLSEQFDTLIRPVAEEVRAILNEMPFPEQTWTGELLDEHITERKMERFEPSSGKNRELGIELTHTITGIKRQSTSRPDLERNRQTARKALEKAVAERYASLQK